MKHSITEILSSFKSENPKKTVFGNYRIEGSELVYRATSTDKVSSWYNAEDFKEAKKKIGEKIRERDGKLMREGKQVLLESLTIDSPKHDYTIQYYETNLIAQKVKSGDGTYLYLGNSATLELIGRTVAYGNESRNNSITEIQLAMGRQSFHMLDLDDERFKDSDFSESFEKIEMGPELNCALTMGRQNRYADETEVSVFHNALLFKLNGKTYLSDIDRRETKYGYLNRFLVEIVQRPVKTIADAYETLKPKDVLYAEHKELDVKRIGSLFLIPVDAPIIKAFTTDEKIEILASVAGYSAGWIVNYITGEKVPENKSSLIDKIPLSRKLDLGRSFTVKECVQLNGLIYCYGKIESSNRASMDLKQWYIAVSNEKIELEKVG